MREIYAKQNNLLFSILSNKPFGEKNEKAQKVSPEGDEILANLLISLIRSAVCGTPLSSEEKSLIDEYSLKKIYELSMRHDLIHLVGYALQQNGLLDVKTHIGDSFRQLLLMSVVRYTKLDYESKRIYNAFEKAKIPFIPLKGSVIRKYYPEPWMRTSCDIDILVHPEDIDKATDILVNGINYTLKEKTEKDISFSSQSEVRLELHFSPIGEFDCGESILKNIWNYAVPSGEGKYEHFLSDAMFSFFHFAHMAKHFLAGGCGIKPFIDIWLLKKNGKLFSKECAEFLALSGLTDFSNAVTALSDVWFSEKEHTCLTLKMQKYIFSGGTYGSFKNFISVNQLKNGGRIKYAFHRIFMPYNSMLKLYPSLENRKILLPFYYIRRIFAVILSGRGKRSLDELLVNSSSDKNSSEIETLFKELKIL